MSSGKYRMASGKQPKLMSKVNIKQAAKLAQQNVNNKKLALEFETGNLYMLKDNTLSKVMKGRIDKNTYVQEAVAVGFSDAELETYVVKAKTITLKVIEPKGDQEPDTRLTKKTRPGGGFLQTRIRPILILAGLQDDKLQQLKIFVMNRIIPKM